MGITSFPGGISAPNIPGGAVGKVFYVGNRSGLPSSAGADPLHPFSTLNGALAKCQADRGDVVKILPGTVLNISTADQMSSLVAGVTIEGIGAGHQRGILRWTAAAATFLLDQPGVILRNLRMQMAGDPAATTALTVAAPITVSAAGCSIVGCDIDVGVDADQIVTVAITVASTDFEFANNTVHGAAAAEITAGGTVIRLTGADRVSIHHNKISAALATDADGLIEALTTASVDINISDNLFHSNGASSDTCMDFGEALVNTGWVARNYCRNLTDGNLNWIVLTGSGVDLQLMDNYGVNNANERGVAIGTASA